jgi:hypothetical protein
MDFDRRDQEVRIASSTIEDLTSLRVLRSAIEAARSACGNAASQIDG